MSTLSTQNKALILFLSEANPLWSIVLTQPASVGKLAAYMKVNPGTIENWKSGNAIHQPTTERAFKTIEQHINSPDLTLTNVRETRAKPKKDVNGVEHKPDPIPICLSLDEPKKKEAFKLLTAFRTKFNSLGGSATADPKPKVVYEIAEAIKIDRPQGQKIIDTVIYERYSIFPNICYGSDQESSAALKRFVGTYDMWVQRKPHWLHARLRVRYDVNIKSRSAIRCKLNFPVIRPEPYTIPYWEYDGWLRTYEDKVFWMFEKRELEGIDFFYFITCRGEVFTFDGETRFTMAGTYLTTHQDKGNSIVSDSVLLQRLPGNNDLKALDDEMHRLDIIKAIDEKEDELEYRRISEKICQYQPRVRS